MSALRYEVMRDLLDIKGMSGDMLRAVLTHPNIAVVEREVEWLMIPYDHTTKTYKAIREYVDNMLKAGWVKEVK